MRILPFLALACLFALTSCSDSPEKIADDQISYLKELTEILDGIAEGEISSSDGAKKIQKWGKKGNKIQERIKALKEKYSDEELQDIDDKYKTEMRDAFKKLMATIVKLQKSGRMTQEIKDAMENVKLN